MSHTIKNGQKGPIYHKNGVKVSRVGGRGDSEGP